MPNFSNRWNPAENLPVSFLDASQTNLPPFFGWGQIGGANFAYFIEDDAFFANGNYDCEVGFMTVPKGFEMFRIDGYNKETFCGIANANCQIPVLLFLRPRPLVPLNPDPLSFPQEHFCDFAINFPGVGSKACAGSIYQCQSKDLIAFKYNEGVGGKKIKIYDAGQGIDQNVEGKFIFPLWLPDQKIIYYFDESFDGMGETTFKNRWREIREAIDNINNLHVASVNGVIDYSDSHDIWITKSASIP